MLKPLPNSKSEKIYLSLKPFIFFSHYYHYFISQASSSLYHLVPSITAP